MADERTEELTPEEKLLKVIQEDGGEQAEASEAAAEEQAPLTAALRAGEEPPPTAEDIAGVAAAEAGPAEMQAEEKVVAAEAAPPPEPAPAAAPATPKKLKLAKGKKAKAAAAEEDGAAAGEEKTGPVIAAGPVVPIGPARAPRFGVGVVNRILAALVLLMVGFAAYEIYASIRTPLVKSDAPAEGTGYEIAEVPASDLPPIEEVIGIFRKRPIIGEPKQQTPPQGPKQPPPTPPFQRYADQNMNLIGLSTPEGDPQAGEAIVVDTKADKMHFLRVGQELTIEGNTVTLKQITADYVVFGVGEEEVRVE